MYENDGFLSVETFIIETLEIFISGGNNFQLLGEINYQNDRKFDIQYKTKAILPKIHLRESILIFDSTYEANLTEKINMITKSTGVRPLFVFMYNAEDHKRNFREL